MRKSFIRTYLNKKRFAYLGFTAFLLTSMLLGISIGTVPISVPVILKIIGADLFRLQVQGIDPMYASIVMDIRFPRVLLAGLVGAALAVAGAAFQGLLRNPLADPYTLGISSGASIGAVVTLFFGISFPFFGSFTLPLLSMFFAFLTVVFVLLFARQVDPLVKVETIILTGIILSSFLGSFISLMIALSGEELRQIIGWLLGSVSMRGWEYIKIILPFFITGVILLLGNARELNAMSFGEERAQHLGVQVEKRKLLILLSGSMLTGSAVAVSGMIGFVGLVIPHFVRILCGPDHRHLLPLSMLSGSGFLILADLLSRTVLAPTELPIGVITSLIGAPVFALILMKNSRERRTGR